MSRFWRITAQNYSPKSQQNLKITNLYGGETEYKCIKKKDDDNLEIPVPQFALSNILNKAQFCIVLNSFQYNQSKEFIYQKPEKG